MRDDLRELRLGQSGVQRAVDVEGHLLGLAGGNQSRDGHQAPVPGRQARASPQVIEQHPVREVRQRRRDDADGCLHRGAAPRFRSLVQRKLLRGGSGDADAPLIKNGFRLMDDRDRNGPARVESKVGDQFRNLAGRDPVIECPAKMPPQLSGAAVRNQCGYRDEA